MSVEGLYATQEELDRAAALMEGNAAFVSTGTVGGRPVAVVSEEDFIGPDSILRIDSPGGSALASEVMWQAARRLAAKKPVVISIGGMAASGGYYLASAGDYIYADASAAAASPPR